MSEGNFLEQFLESLERIAQLEARLTALEAERGSFVRHQQTLARHMRRMIREKDTMLQAMLGRAELPVRIEGSDELERVLQTLASDTREPRTYYGTCKRCGQHPYDGHSLCSTPAGIA